MVHNYFPLTRIQHFFNSYNLHIFCIKFIIQSNDDSFLLQLVEAPREYYCSTHQKKYIHLHITIDRLQLLVGI